VCLLGLSFRSSYDKKRSNPFIVIMSEVEIGDISSLALENKTFINERESDK
jgi:hypothetical protein